MALIEKRNSIKFCVKLGYSVTRTMEPLQSAYGDSALKRTTVHEWHRRFASGRAEVKDDEREGRPITVTSPETIAKAELAI